MQKIIFMSFSESDRKAVTMIKGRACNAGYSGLSFRQRDLLSRWNTTSTAGIRRAISSKMTGTSRTIVFVGDDTWKSNWVGQEIEMTLDRDKPVYAIRLRNTCGKTPEALARHGIAVQPWSEENLQKLAM